MMENKRIAFVASECQPFITSGGLGEVIGSLPKKLVKLDKGTYEVSVYLPLYGTMSKLYREKLEYVGNIVVQLSWRRQYCGVYKYEENGVRYYFIDNEYYFKRERLYGYFDDAERFAFFSKAVVDVMKYVGEMLDVVHCHDWQTGLVPVYLRTLYYNDPFFKDTKRIFTIHNIEYQGCYSLDSDMVCGIFGLHENDTYLLEYNNTLNIMKGAMESSNIVSTVSASYAEEIKSPAYGHGLEGEVNRVAMEGKLCGILNGIDTVFYNPNTDKALYKKYSTKDISLKEINKQQLCEQVGLNYNKNTLLVGMITRLVAHKGLEIVKQAFEEIIQKDLQIVILGTGDAYYEGYLKEMEARYPEKLRVILAFNQDLARKIYAATDLFLMPSASEPCGLSQMIACRYGAVPLVRATGGLKDSIHDFNTGDGNGYSFEGFEAHDLALTVERAVQDHLSADWSTKVEKVMKEDFSWNVSAKAYGKMYKKLLAK